MLRYILGFCLVAACVVWLVAVRVLAPVSIPVPVFQVVNLDPYDHALLDSYKRFRDASLSADRSTVQDLAFGSETFLAYRAALSLAQDEALSAAERLPYYQRVFALRIDDPLDILDRRALLSEYARTAEAAGDIALALELYQQLLPRTEAANALNRLQTDPYRRANAYVNARMHQAALDALAGRTAPSLEAPAYAALGEHQKALDAYNRWLAEVPDSTTALLGKAWSHYRLGDNEAAENLFAQIGGNTALYARALIARRQGSTDRAVELLSQSSDAYHLWLATEFLEAAGRSADAIALYLRLARGTTAYADDAAYRAYILATRLGLSDLQAEARSLIPGGSFFGRKLGQPLFIPQDSSLPQLELPVIEQASLLAGLQDREAAVGELLFALRAASQPAERLAIAEALQQHGEYRQSQRAAILLLESGLNDRRLWYVSYPQAYRQYVLGEAQNWNVDPALVWAVMRQESAFFPKAISTSNAQGLMQVIPSTWNWLAELQRESPPDPFNPADNVRYGVYYLRWLKNFFSEYEGDLELVVASYNRGQGYIRRLFEGDVVNVNKDDLYREIDAFETREYLQRVMTNYEVYRQLYGAEIEAWRSAE